MSTEEHATLTSISITINIGRNTFTKDFHKGLLHPWTLFFLDFLTPFHKTI